MVDAGDGVDAEGTEDGDVAAGVGEPPTWEPCADGAIADDAGDVRVMVVVEGDDGDDGDDGDVAAADADEDDDDDDDVP